MQLKSVLAVVLAISGVALAAPPADRPERAGWAVMTLRPKPAPASTQPAAAGATPVPPPPAVKVARPPNVIKLTHPAHKSGSELFKPAVMPVKAAPAAPAADKDD
ncbi:hypothetical protein TWF281_005927 [Arthrobotrys megalospora]